MSVPAPSKAQSLTAVQWLICTIAAIGFAFDIYELLMAPLIVRPAIMELGPFSPGSKEFVSWASSFFYVPALVGGAVGLLGGYLTDRLGRRRVLTWSILLYAFSAFAAGFSTNLWMLLFFRTTTFVGVCVEFVAAVAWLAELFDDADQREKVLGYTQAFSSIGGLMVAVANALAVQYALDLPAIWFGHGISPVEGVTLDAHAAWRYTLMSGLIPAIPLILIRPFLPESPKWAARKAAGTLRRPSITELFSPELRTTTIVTTLMFAASYGVAFGAIQQMPQIVPGLDVVRAEIKDATEGKPKDAIPKISGRITQEKAADYTKAQELGGLVGRFLLAAVVVLFASRRALLRVFLVPGLVLMPLIFLGFARGQEMTYFSIDISWLPGFHTFSVSLLGLGIFLAGFFTVAQFSFWGNYLPHAYPVHLRGTGESFAANIGGRMIGTLFFGVTQWLAVAIYGEFKGPEAFKAAPGLATVAAGVATGLFLLNLILSCWLPEPKPGTVEHD